MDSNACSMKQPSKHYKPYGRARTDINNKKTFKEDKKLCNLVEQHPQLYDKGHRGYGQKKATDEAWRTIAESLRKSVSQCKARWEKLRAEYIAYLRSLEADKEQHGRKRQFKETAVAANVHEISAMKQASGDGNDCIQNEIKYLVDKIDEQGLRTLQEIIQRRINKCSNQDMFSTSKPQLVNDEVTIKIEDIL